MVPRTSNSPTLGPDGVLLVTFRVWQISTDGHAGAGP